MTESKKKTGKTTAYKQAQKPVGNTESEKKTGKTTARKQARKPVSNAGSRQQVEAAQSVNEVAVTPSSVGTAVSTKAFGAEATAKVVTAETVAVSETVNETKGVQPTPEAAISRVVEVERPIGEVVTAKPSGNKAADSQFAGIEPAVSKTAGSTVAEVEPVIRAAAVSTVAEVEQPVSTAPVSAGAEAEAPVNEAPVSEVVVVETPVRKAPAGAVAEGEAPVSPVTGAEPAVSEVSVSPVAETEPAVSEAPVGEAVIPEAPVNEVTLAESVAVVAIAPPPEEPRHEEPRYVRPPLENKYLNKEALRERLWLRKEFKPIISYVGRLDYQKGVHLIRHGIFYALQHGAQFVLLGVSPEHRVNEEFWHLKRHLNDNPDCHLEIGFNEELAHLIYAGSDMTIMPSLYEPCGLTQMIALKYGTVPIVRAVGGLVDTVFDRDNAANPPEERNGYVFHGADAAGLESAMSRAIGLWYSYPDEFRKLVINGMKYDFSWKHPGQHYLNIYEHIRCK